MIRDFRFL